MNNKSIYELNRIQQYMMQMRPVLNKQALFSDGTIDYLDPTEPNPGEIVHIRFRTAKDNVDAVWLCTAMQKYQMKKVETEGRFDFYEVELLVGEEIISYHFEVCSGQLVCYYGIAGAMTEPDQRYDLCVIPGFQTPAWAKGAVMYQIFVDRFFNGDETNDVEDNEYHYISYKSKKADFWDKVPDANNVAEFYGGDLEGVRKKLSYLKELGVEVLYFNPIFVSPSNHKYDIQDYDYIDPHLTKIVKEDGEFLEKDETDNQKATKYQTRVTDKANLEASNEYFAQFVKEVHAQGMKIILDGVFNHCGSFHKWLDKERIYETKAEYEKGAFVAEESPYHDFFWFVPGSEWPYNAQYEGWWGHDTLPKLQYERSAELEDYILRIAKKWVSEPYCVDGWRLDVAADLGKSLEYNHRFWKKFRQAVKEANPNALILAEHYGDASDWIKGKEWDSVMNYDAFMEPVSWFLTGVNKHSEVYRPQLQGNIEQFCETMDHCMTRLVTPALQCAMNELSNHDHSRFLTRTNHKTGRVTDLGAKAAEEEINKAIMRAAVAIQMTWPGAPTVYYGDEAGVCGFTDPDNRRTYPWGHEDRQMISFHKEVIKIHKSSEAFRTGSIKLVKGEEGLLCYGRFNRAEQYIIIVNTKEHTGAVRIPAWELGIPRDAVLVQQIFTHEEGYSTMPVEYQLTDGSFDIHMPKYSAIILKRQ